MDFPREFTDGLDELTAALDMPGTDLQAILSVLSDDLTSTIPSFLGLSLTLYAAGQGVTLTAHQGESLESAQAFLVMPLESADPADPASKVVFYAESAGAFTDLAADLALVRPGVHTTRPPEAAPTTQGPLATDESPASGVRTAQGISGLIELGLINQAIGVMLDRGLTPERARAELQRQAQEQGRTVAEVADRLLDTIIRTAGGPTQDRADDERAGGETDGPAS